MRSSSPFHFDPDPDSDPDFDEVFPNIILIAQVEKFNRRHIVDIARIKFFAQHRYRANWPFMDGHELMIAIEKGQ